MARGRRDEALRRVREGQTASRIEAPSAVDGTERRALLRSVVDAVLGLPEPYQTILLLRYYSGLSVREVGNRVGSSHAKVRHQLERALELLEEMLSESHGEARPGWRHELAAICSFTVSSGGLSASKASIGAGLMMAKTKSLALFVVLAVALATLFFGWEAIRAGDDEELEARSDATRLSEAALPRREDAEREAPPLAAEGASKSDTQVKPEAPTRPEGLRLEVVWEIDGTPAANVLMSIRPLGVFASVANTEHHRTDGEGIVHLGGIPESGLFVGADRFPRKMLARIKPDATGPVLVKVPRGIDLHGRVVDPAGTAVAGAEILLAGTNAFASTARIGSSGVDGSFSLRQIAPRCFVAARHPEFAPSDLYAPPASTGGVAELTLELDAAWCRIEGRVLNERGQPVARALVKAGETEWRRRPDASGAGRYTPPAALIRTDRAGRFDTGRLRAGSIRLLVASVDASHSRHSQEFSLAAEEVEQVEIHLKAAPTLHGTVRDELGTPIPKVYITVGDFDADLNRGIVKSDAVGRYTFTGAPVGKVTVQARSGSGTKVVEEIELSSGERREWNPVLARGACLKGRLVRKSGATTKGWSVLAKMVDHEASNWSRSLQVDAAGRFEFTQCPAGDISVSFSHLKETAGLPAKVVIAQAGDTELLVTLGEDDIPAARIKGKVVTAKGTRPPSVMIWLGRTDSNRATGHTVTADDGSFDIGPLAAARYRIKIDATGFGGNQTRPVRPRSP